MTAFTPLLRRMESFASFSFMLVDKHPANYMEIEKN